MRREAVTSLKAAASALAVVFILVSGMLSATGCGAPTITVATTKSTVDSGLLDTLLPAFEKTYGVKVNVVSAPTCEKALKEAEAGNADVALTHSEAAEAEFLAKGYGVDKADVMYSDYVLLGPASDPAEVKSFDCPARSSKKIATLGITYVSRSDGSDLHKKELGYWQKNGYGDPTGQAWYVKTGKGMVETLKIADDKQGYVLSDMETYLKMKDRLSIIPVVQGCTMLFNRYAAIVVSPEQKSDGAAGTGDAEKFVTFLTSRSGQSVIGNYRKSGAALFHPSAGESSNTTI